MCQDHSYVTTKIYLITFYLGRYCIIIVNANQKYLALLAQNDVIYTDMENPFDKIDNDLQIIKL